MKTFDEFIVEEEIRTCRSQEQYEIDYFRKSWEACLKAQTESVADVPCSDRVMEPALDRLNKRVKELEDDNEEAIRHGNKAMENLLGRTISSYKMAIDYLASRAA